MSARACVVCGRPAADDHHLTGSKLDPDLTLPHCHDHHELNHDDWWTAGVGAKRPKARNDDEDTPATFLHGLYLRLRRLAMFLGRLVEAGLFLPLSSLLASALAGWAVRLRGCIDALDAGKPGWADLPGLAE